MFSRLRHHAFIQANHEKDKVNAADAHQHIFNESFMSRNINDADVIFSAIHVSESVFDCDASFLFFFQSVCIFSGQRLDQTGFSMVYMTGRSDNEILHSFCVLFSSRKISASFRATHGISSSDIVLTSRINLSL